MRVLRKNLKEEISPAYFGDCERIRDVLHSAGIQVSLLEAEKLWNDHSDTYCAGWLFLPEKNEELLDILTEEVS